TPDPDPIIYLSGGPGGPVEGLVAAFRGPAAENFTATRDFIIFDQRGVGRSQPALNCPEVAERFLQDAPRALNPDEEDDHFIAAARQCRDRLVRQGIDLAAYTTAQSAADVNAIRTALGYDQINLLGVSYGTTLALAVLRDFPEIVRSAVLDSVAPPQVDWLEEIAPAFDRALNLNFATCVAQQQCLMDVETLQAAFGRAFANLNAQPVTVAVTDPRGRPTDYVVTGHRLVSLIHGSLYNPASIEVMPALIEELSRGEETALRGLVRQRFPALSRFSISVGMHLSVLCGEQVSADSMAKAEAAERDLLPEIRDSYSIRDIVTICAEWPVEKVEGGSPGAVESDRPALVLASANDPITPPTYGQAAAATLSRSFYVETPGIGHGVFGSGCGGSIIMRFFADPSTRPGTACTARMGVTFPTTPPP
ncbi:MAG: alpha/beta hydrolase, partial [Chloroflexota bacterium]|nr:alpha/beta hydrolase [Chloroflexota bacterium]